MSCGRSVVFLRQFRWFSLCLRAPKTALSVQPPHLVRRVWPSPPIKNKKKIIPLKTVTLGHKCAPIWLEVDSTLCQLGLAIPRPKKIG
jgi:hypothetical protein